ncbi:twin-arginine translocase subunit TatC [Paenibacillus sambharensis]|uniref:Sec-independent protein translocase protein TatC n=1 Tax=Paenibacillus sambharensis TaxID=1803190 RepID=A0A2W1L602_9BACL|nr:twin-arginine translocase subunit TatC [Paenibacillus sambharensis]PZD94696.1 twin-arginine translocase subunit TatC [Paenibacillus sambharensis]
MDTMNVIGHLGELRKRIMVTMFAFVGALAAALCCVQQIYGWLTQHLDMRLALLGPSDILWVYMMISAVIAAAVTTPVFAYQLWRFVKPALSAEEHRAAFHMIPAVSLLFIGGINFGYFIVFPVVSSFLLGLSAGQFQTLYTAEKYFRFMVNLTLPFGLLFEMPAVVIFLTRLGILNPERLAKARKTAYFALVVTAVTVTPPDIVSDVLVIIPLLLLYECSVSLSRIVYRKRLRRMAEEEQRAGTALSGL